MNIIGTPQIVGATLPGSNYFDLPSELQAGVVKARLRQAPTTVDVVVTSAPADEELTFYIDDVLITTETSTTDGGLGPLALEVDATHGAGAHTIKVTAAGWISATTTFTLTLDPNPNVATAADDVAPQSVPEALVDGRRRWVLQDLTPGGLGSWVMTPSPTSMEPIPRDRELSAEHTTHPEGQFHIGEPVWMPKRWSFAGYCPDAAFSDQLLAYRALRRRFYLIDHRNRAWVVAFEDVELVPRKRQKDDDGAFNDDAADYTVRAVIYERDPKTPA